MWYYDNYQKHSDLVTRLMSNMGGGEYLPTPYFGFIDRLPELTANHQWKDSGSIVGSVMSGIKHFGQSMTNIGEDFGAGSVNAVKMMSGDTETISTTSFYNMIITNAASMLKEYDGTEIDISIPSYTVYFISDTYNYRVRNEVYAFLDSNKLLGDSFLDFNDITTFPPGEFRFSPREYRNQVNVNGSFALANSRFILRNLVPTSVSIEFSEATKAENGIVSKDPLYAKVTLSFTYGRKPTQRAALDFLGNTGVASEDYTDISSLFSFDTTSGIKEGKDIRDTVFTDDIAKRRREYSKQQEAENLENSKRASAEASKKRREAEAQAKQNQQANQQNQSTQTNQ